MSPDRGLHLADGTLFWVVFADSEGSRVAWLPWVPRPASAVRSKEPYRRLQIELGHEVAIIVRDGSWPATRDQRATGRRAVGA